MSWLSRLFGKESHSTTSAELPLFPIWLEQQGDISVQDGLDRYIQQYMSLEPVETTTSLRKTFEQRKKRIAVQEAEVKLLEQCMDHYDEEVMSPEFNDLLSTKSLALQMSLNALEMKLKSERVIREAKERAAAQNKS